MGNKGGPDLLGKAQQMGGSGGVLWALPTCNAVITLLDWSENVQNSSQ